MTDPIAIVSWLMSNYKLHKIGEYDPVITKNVKQVTSKQEEPKSKPEEPKSKHSDIIEHIQKMSGLDVLKNQTVKSLKEKSEAQGGKETMVSMGDEPDDAVGDSGYMSDPDEIDDLMNTEVVQQMGKKK